MVKNYHEMPVAPISGTNISLLDGEEADLYPCKDDLLDLKSLIEECEEDENVVCVYMYVLRELGPHVILMLTNKGRGYFINEDGDEWVGTIRDIYFIKHLDMYESGMMLCKNSAGEMFLYDCCREQIFLPSFIKDILSLKIENNREFWECLECTIDTPNGKYRIVDAIIFEDEDIIENYAGEFDYYLFPALEGLSSAEAFRICDKRDVFYLKEGTLYR